MWGMQRTLVNNLVRGVTEGFSEKLEIAGVGYRAPCRARTCNCNWVSRMTWSIRSPPGIGIVCEKPTL